MSAVVTRAFIASALCVAQTGFANTLLPAMPVTGTRFYDGSRVLVPGGRYSSGRHRKFQSQRIV
jgi:hypothetical protein